MLLLFPAMMMVLVITHSPLQAINPSALYRVITELGWTYLLAPLAGILLVMVTVLDSLLHAWLAWFVALFAMASFYCVIGALLDNTGLLADIDISDAWDPDENDPTVVASQLEKRRTAILNHAYGLMSRGNRDGGLQHIQTWLANDEEAGWSWFFEGQDRQTAAHCE